MTTISRRHVLGTGAAFAGALAAPGLLKAQAGPIRIGTLTPLTGSGGAFGPSMATVAKKVAEEINKAGGIAGRELAIVSEDDQTNPEAGLRAARKLVDIDKVVAIAGTWASSVTTAVAPVCWQSGVFLATVSGADSITRLPHQGYLVRTQPNTTLQGRKFAEYALERGAKTLAFMSPQTPFTDSLFEQFTTILGKAGGSATKLVYDDKKATFRTEVDGVLRGKPDAIIMGGYAPDVAILARDLYRANYRGTLMGFGYGINKQFVEAVPPEVSENIATLSPSSAADSNAYKAVGRLLGTETPDPYSCQVYDHVSLIALALAAGRGDTGTVIKDTIRTVSQGGGERVDNAVDGLKLIAAGRKIEYDGASGPCDFDAIGDIVDAKFRYEVVKGGKITFVKIA